MSKKLYFDEDPEDKRKRVNRDRQLRKNKRMESGLCSLCGKHQPKDGCKTCEHCLQKGMDRYAGKSDLWNVKGKERRASRKESGLCPDCGKRPPEKEGVLRCGECLERSRSAGKKHDATRRENSRNRRLAGACGTCGGPLSPSDRVNCVACRRRELGYKIANPDHRKNKKEIRKKIRFSVISKYGGVCECCGESNYRFLCIDHINNNGSQERKEKEGKSFYNHLLRVEPRDDLRVLCYNCNIGRHHNDGICPHKMDDDGNEKAVE